MGKQVLEHGLTEDQINMFLLASHSLDANDMISQQIAYAASQSKDAAKEMQKIVDKKHNLLKIRLVRELWQK